MCQHLFNSLSTIRNIYSPASTETSLICSLRKKRQTLEMVLHFRGRKGKWAVVFYLSSGNASAEPEQVPQPGAATPAWLLRMLLLFQKHKEHAELILGSQTFPASFPAPAFHSQPFRKSLGLSLLLHNPWSCSFSVWLWSVHALRTFAQAQKHLSSVQKVWPCQILLHKGLGPKSISLGSV